MPEISVVNRFLALLALTAAAGSVVLTVAAVAGGPGPRWLTSVRDAALPLAWLVAAVATAGSLYYSEVVGFEPCRLCWYQRIAMYPFVVILGIAALRADTAVRTYVVPLAGLGLAVSGWHYLIQQVPSLAPAGACSASAPCTAAYVSDLGFVTIPLMAGCGFLAVIVLLSLTRGRAVRRTPATG